MCTKVVIIKIKKEATKRKNNRNAYCKIIIRMIENYIVFYFNHYFDETRFFLNKRKISTTPFFLEPIIIIIMEIYNKKNSD